MLYYRLPDKGGNPRYRPAIATSKTDANGLNLRVILEPGDVDFCPSGSSKFVPGARAGDAVGQFSGPVAVPRLASKPFLGSRDEAELDTLTGESVMEARDDLDRTELQRRLESELAALSEEKQLEAAEAILSKGAALNRELTEHEEGLLSELRGAVEKVRAPAEE